MELSKREKRKLRLSSTGSSDTIKEEKPIEFSKPTSSKKKLPYILAVIGILVVAIAGYGIYSIAKPGPYDDFAKCLTSKGAVIYGAIDWCKYTQVQKAMFGNSFKYLNYKDYKELSGIKKTPTWVINGVWYENVQAFDKLASVTGCTL